MSIAHKVAAASYYPARWAKRIAELTGIRSRHALRVLIYHDIPPGEVTNFRKQLHWLKKSWNFISPHEFSAIMSGDRHYDGRNLLLTFDDGFASNKKIAVDILDELGIKAIFFIISGFAAIENRDEARRFISSNILPGTAPQNLPEHMYNMSWSELNELIKLGHEIGAHTGTHARLSSITNKDQLMREIVSSADTIAQKIGVNVNHFAYTFGDLASFSPEALAIAAQRFKFIYSGIRGNNSSNTSPFALRRDSLQTYHSLWQAGSFLEGTTDLLYAQSREKLDRWVAELSVKRPD